MPSKNVQSRDHKFSIIERGIMLQLISQGLKRKTLAIFGVLLFCTTSIFGQATTIYKVNNWKNFRSIQGNCTVSLPSSPEHVKQVMPFPEQGYNLRYDVYVSAFEKKAVYMMLIAEYPPFINESYAELSLESFLNGIVTQNVNNKLIFADLTEVQGHKALYFFIEAKGVDFKGRAIMSKNYLYLLAMECEMKNYLEDHYKHFIGSFNLDLK